MQLDTRLRRRIAAAAIAGLAAATLVTPAASAQAALVGGAQAALVGGAQAALVGGAQAALVGGAQAATAGCRVNYTVPVQFPGNFLAEVFITNLGAPINGWHLVWTLPSGERVRQIFRANADSPGPRVTATSLYWNAALATNATVSFGFYGSTPNATAGVPTSFELNGVPCTT